MGLAVITGRFLLRFLLVLQETLSFGECRRRLLRDYFAVAMGAEEGEGGRSARALAGSIARFFPRRKLLRTIAMRAFPGPISRRVSNLSAMQAAYNGSGIRIDGNFKSVKKYRRRWDRGSDRTSAASWGSAAPTAPRSNRSRPFAPKASRARGVSEIDHLPACPLQKRPRLFRAKAGNFFVPSIIEERKRMRRGADDRGIGRKGGAGGPARPAWASGI